MPRHKVCVTLIAECEVEIEVECGEDEDPTDLSKEERARAIELAEDRLPRWTVDQAQVIARESGQ
jgi:hypothetical protein